MGTVPRAEKKKREYRLHLKSNQQFYNSKAWRSLSKRIKEERVWCEWCFARDLLVEGRFVDHVIPINKGGDLFPSDQELQLLCTSCDARKRGRGG
jgi:5-methylcytosine-specific restriction endonuclease McrA